MLEISIREKHRILMRSVLSADKTPHTNKEEVYRYTVTTRDVFIIEHLIDQWAYELLMIFECHFVTEDGFTIS